MSETKETSSRIPYTAEMGSQICAALAEGKTLRDFCKEDGAPKMRAIFYWLGKHPEFAEQYRLASTQRTDSGYTPEIGDQICEELSDGKSLKAICDQEWAPSRRTVFMWLRKHIEFRQLYAIAQIEGAHAHVDDALAIADDGRNDWMANNDPDNPGYRVNGEAIGRSRLRVDTRKWAAARLAPNLYGDRVTAELVGANGGPIQTADVSESELARRIAFALASGLKQPEQVH